MIVITTPTGSIGRQLLDDLIDGEEAIRVIARDPSRLPERVRERAEVVPGSHTDREVVMKAFESADRLFWVVPPDHSVPDVEAHYLDSTRPACEAIEAHGVRQVVAVSTMGVGIEKNAGHLSAARATDDLIAGTGVAYRSLRPPTFMENLLRQIDPIRDQGTFFLPHPADRVLATVATRDIAAKGAELLRDHSWTGYEGVPVISPDALTPDEMARIMSEVLERPVRFQSVPVEAFRQSMLQRGASEDSARCLADMATAQSNGAYDEEQRTTRPGPTGFRQWCEEVLKPAVLG
ncbi:NAD(P)H-binding protein [Streptomyces sp. NPDC092369]|uniref:NAD(P)H-binding protein n=1 Tax=Streptomyces sp. NPDC092369 TaxID=3366015 RepID=UPI00382C7DB6